MGAAARLAEPFADTAAKVAAAPAELAAASDLVCLCVVGDADVREVVTGADGVLAGMAAGTILAVHSTVHPDTCRDLADIAVAQGFRSSTHRSAVAALQPPRAGCW